MARKAHAPGPEAESLRDGLIDQAKRDRQAQLGLQDGREVAVGGVVVVQRVAGELQFLEEVLVHVRQQPLRLSAADARADRVRVALERRVDLGWVGALQLVRRHRDRALQQRVGGIDRRKLVRQQPKGVGRTADGKSRQHNALRGLADFAIDQWESFYAHSMPRRPQRSRPDAGVRWLTLRDDGR